MALPTTNLSLNAIHVEVGGTTGTTCSLNDADIRGIATTDPTYDGGDGINQTSGTTVSIGEFRNASDTPSVTVSPVSTNVNTSRTGGCYAIVSYYSNGVEYNNNTSGANNGTYNETAVSRGNWLDSGDASSIYIDCTINSGSLTQNPCSGGRVLMSSNRVFYNYTTSGFQNANITISFHSAATGGTNYGSATFTLNANGGL